MNQWRKNSYPLKQLSIGADLALETFTLDTGHAGPHIHMQASVHGAEIQGNALIMNLMQKLPAILKSGSITFIPFANPYATLQKVGTHTLGRVNPVTGHNWNRNFVDIISATKFNLKEYCQKVLLANTDEKSIIANFKNKLSELYERYWSELEKDHQLHDNNFLNLLLQKISAKADYVLDLHTGPIATEYIYTPSYSLPIAKLFNINHILETPDCFAGAMDEAFSMPWFELAKELKLKIYNAAYTIELESEENFSMQAAEKSSQGILNFLAHLKMIDISDASQNPESKLYICKLDDFKTIYAAKGGLFDYLVKPGQHFKQGEVLAICYQRPQLIGNDIAMKNYSFEIQAPWDGILINRCPSSNVHQGMELFQCMTNTRKE